MSETTTEQTLKTLTGPLAPELRALQAEILTVYKAGGESYGPLATAYMALVERFGEAIAKPVVEHDNSRRMSAYINGAGDRYVARRMRRVFKRVGIKDAQIADAVKAASDSMGPDAKMAEITIRREGTEAEMPFHLTAAIAALEADDAGLDADERVLAERWHEIQEFISTGPGTRSERMASVVARTNAASAADVEHLLEQPFAETVRERREQLRLVEQLGVEIEVLRERVKIFEWLSRHHAVKTAPWLVALHALYAARAGLKTIRENAPANHQDIFGPLWASDADALQQAEVYNWGTEPIDACIRASASVPRDSTFKEELMPPGPSGWWYFDTPVACATTTKHNTVLALTWGWVDGELRGRAIRVTAYVWHEKIGPAGTGSFLWYPGESIEELLARTAADWAIIDADITKKIPRGQHSLPLDRHMVATEFMARFFLAALVWLREEIVVESPGHVERHVRKQLARDFNDTRAPSTVKIIHLRKAVARQSTEADHAPDAEGRRQYACRWLVDGHFRNQACGPGRAERKLIYIMPFMKGPDDKPFVAKDRIYQVVR